ncbi:MAG: PQQ-dependent sugar dehydrogenase, partial [Anaerolineales bacterium]|nr:PQQ-dependent sugar dehydrogenase [Anaerolineales bacterium]
MKRLILLLTLPLLACGGLAEPVSPTATPLASHPPTAVPTIQTDSQPQPDTATTAPTRSLPPTVSQFPNTNNYEWLLIASGLNRPVDVQSALDGSGRLFIIEKYGVIRVYENGQMLEQPFLNIDDRVNDDSNEMGLLGLAFHPDYEQNGFFYVNYTGTGGNTFISRFQASGNVADVGSESIL